MTVASFEVFCVASLACVGVWASSDAENQWARIIKAIRSPDRQVRLAAAEELPEVAFATRAAKRTAAQGLVFKDQLQTLAKIIRDKKEHPRVRTLVVHAFAVGELGSMAHVAVTSVVGVIQDEAEDDVLRCEAVMCLARTTQKRASARVLPRNCVSSARKRKM